MDKNPLIDNATALIVNLKKFDKQYNDLTNEIRQQEKDKILLEENINLLNDELEKLIDERDYLANKREEIFGLLEQAETQKEKMSRDYSMLLMNLKKERENLF